MGPSASVFFKRLASLLSVKRNAHYGSVMAWIRCKISFALIHSAVLYNHDISLSLSCPVHCGSTRQTASILTMDREHLRTGDKVTCRFRFIKGPEFLHVGTRMVFKVVLKLSAASQRPIRINQDSNQLE